MNRVKIYTADGAFQGVVAGAEQLEADADPVAARALGNCRVGCAYDVAVDSKGTIFILDPKHKLVRVFSAVA